MSDGKTNESVEGLVLAAGLGTGVGEGPKAFLRLKGRSLLRMTVDGLLPHVDRVIVAVPPSHMAEALAEVGDVATVIEGGETRQDSVERVVDASAAPVLLLSEVCRPLFSGELVRKVRDLAPVHGSPFRSSRRISRLPCVMASRARSRWSLSRCCYRSFRKVIRAR